MSVGAFLLPTVRSVRSVCGCLFVASCQVSEISLWVSFCCQLSGQWDQSVGVFLLPIVRSVRSVCGCLLLSSVFPFFMKIVHLFPRRWTAHMMWLISVRLSLGNHILSWRADLVFAVFLCSQTVVWLQMLGIFKMPPKVDACNWHYCTQGLYHQPALKVDWEGNLLLYQGVEPTLSCIPTLLLLSMVRLLRSPLTSGTGCQRSCINGTTKCWPKSFDPTYNDSSLLCVDTVS